jgi:hypothetical protein
LAAAFTDSASVCFVIAIIGLGRQNISGETATILGARVGGMTAKRVKLAARVLPDTTPLVPMKAQSPKQIRQTGFLSGRDIQPNPFADNLGNRVRK